MWKRVLPITVIVLCALWSIYISFDLLSGEGNADFRYYFDTSDVELLVIHHPEEIDWDEANFQVLPTNLTLYQSISKHLPKNASVYLSNKRPYILIEQAENWTVSSIKYLFGSGIYKFDKKTGRNFTFGNYSGIYKRHQLLLYQGELNFAAKNFLPAVDKKASYSLIQLRVDHSTNTDVYQKADRTYTYRQEFLNWKGGKSIDDKRLFSGIIPANFSSYSFYETNYLAKKDTAFGKSKFKLWTKTGMVILENERNERVAVFDFKEGQNPIQNINEALGMEETNEDFARFPGVYFSDLLQQKDTSDIYVSEMENICIISTNKAYLDEVTTEMKLGNSLSQNEEKLKGIFGGLPAKVSSRIVTTDKLLATSIYGQKLVTTNCIKKDYVGNKTDEDVKDYFSMNPGEAILDFVAMSGRGNVVVLTESFKLIGYVNGSKKWEKQFESAPESFDLFSNEKNQVSVLFQNEIQIYDQTGRVLYRFVGNTAPTSAVMDGKIYFLVRNNKGSLGILNDGNKVQRTIRTSENIEKSVLFKSKNKSFAGAQTNTNFYYTDLNRKSGLQRVAIDTATQVFSINDNLIFCTVTNGICTINKLNESKVQAKIPLGSELMGAIDIAGNPCALLKTGKNLFVIDTKGKRVWSLFVNAHEVSSVVVSKNNRGKFIIGVLDALENQLYLFSANGTKLDENQRHGETKLTLSPFGTKAYSITTYLGSYLIQYTKL